MIKRKSFFTLALVVALLLTVTSSRSTLAQSSGKSFKIGVANNFVDSEWRTQMLQDLQDVAKDLKANQGIDVTLDIESKDTDVPGQIKQVQDLLDRGAQAIIIDPGDIKGLNATLEDAVTGGVPVISVDQAIDAKGVVNVVIDQTDWAKISTTWLAEKLNGKGDIVLIEGVPGHPANEARMSGVTSVLAKYPNIKIVGRQAANWDEATGQKVMSTFLTSLPNIDGVWTQDGMAEGVLTALQTAKPKKWPIVSGEARAGYLQQWAAVAKDNPAFTSFGVVNPPGSAGTGLRVAVEMLTGTKIDPSALKGTASNTLFIPIPFTVDSTNFDAQYAFVKDLPASYVLDGILTADQVKQLMAGKLTIDEPTASTPEPMAAATMAATAAK